jgi:hypothetical protein
MSTAAVATRVDELMVQLAGRSLVDRTWFVDQLLDLASLMPESAISAKTHLVMGEVAGQRLVDRRYCVDQLLDIRVLAVPPV